MLQRILFLLSAKGVFVFLLISLAAQYGYGQEKPKQDAPEVSTLEFNQPVEREIAAKESHNYQLTLAANQFVSIIIEQRGIDVFARVSHSPDKKPFVQRDSVLTPEGQEKLDFTATEAGVYLLEVGGKTMSSAKGKYLVRLAEIRPATEREKRLEEARTIHNDGARLWGEGKFAEALPIAERAVEIREKESGADDVDLAASLSSLALIVNDLGDSQRAIALYERSLKVRQEAFGENHQDVANIYNNLAIVYAGLDNYAEAIRLWTKAAEIREKVLGFDNLDLAAAFNNIGTAYKALGDYEKAESSVRRAFEVMNRRPEPNYPGIAYLQSNLAGIYLAKSDQDKALEFYRQAVANREKGFGAEHPTVAYGLFNTALILSDKGEFASAETDFLRALKILQKAYGQDHQRIAQILSSLAVLYSHQGDDAKAEPLFTQAVAMMEKTVGRENSDYAAAIVNLAEFYANKGDYQKAEPLYQQAIIIVEKIFGTQHPSLIPFLTGLARNYEAQGKVDLAIDTLKRAHELSERHSQIVLFAESERQKLAYLDSLNAETDQFISIHQQFAPNNPTALEIALTTVLERKGRVSDALTLEFAALQSRFNKEDQGVLEELKKVNSILAQKALNESPRIKPEEYQKQIAELENRKENLEIEISRRSSEFRSRTQPVTISAVRSAIPENAALIEFNIYRPFNPKTKSIGTQAFGEPRCVAYIIRRQGVVQWKDLGTVKSLNDVIEPLRQALRDPKRQDAPQFARRADEKIMQPIRALLGDAKQLLVSPDGELNLIPFEALVDEQNRYLIENYSFTYLTGGRDLLRLQTARTSKSKSLLIANPQFGEIVAEQAVAVNQTKMKSRAKRQSVTATRNMTDTYFAPLGGTLQEGRSIQALFPDTTFLTGTQATETALKQANAPTILHIATHGFFLEDENTATDKDQSATTRNSKTNVESENPLLRSGLALAGANRRNSDNGDDGILTALEASGLNLWGTKLVVLSACDTGLGAIKNGEGVYGLRRSFVLSGAESLVMSLWSVSDQITRELMTNYYKNLKSGMGRGAALRQVQLEMLKKKGREQPFYWAAFIQSGEWANLDGKR